MVVEVKPAAAHKGAALRRLAAAPPFAGRRPLMIGDDTTDEDAIAAAQDLGGLGVKVGQGALRRPPPRPRPRRPCAPGSPGNRPAPTVNLSIRRPNHTYRFHTVSIPIPDARNRP